MLLAVSEPTKTIKVCFALKIKPRWSGDMRIIDWKAKLVWNAGI